MTLNKMTVFAAAVFAATLGWAALDAHAVQVDYVVTTPGSPFGVFYSTGPGYIGGRSNDVSNPSSTGGFSVFNGSTDPNDPHQGSNKRVNVEVDLQRVRDVSTDPADINSAVFEFYLDDIIFATTPGFANDVMASLVLELYVDSADGVISQGTDAGTGTNVDYDGGAIGSVNFQSDAGTPLPPIDTGWLNGDYPELLAPGVTYTGTIGDTLNYPETYTDNDFDARGFLGFQIDVTNLLKSVVANGANTHLGFRLYSPAIDPSWTSLDRPGFEPALRVDVVPEPSALALLGLGGLVMAARRRR